MKNELLRRDFLKRFGLSASVAPFLGSLPSLRAEAKAQEKRIVFVFSPNGTIPHEFWPNQTGVDFQFKRILKPLEKFRDRTAIFHGLCNKIKGDGDNHMRGMSCLLTADQLLPGNIQGGSHTPAGWARGISIDQEIKNFLQSNPATATRFGSLEFGVAVPNRADPWTRMSYAGGNQPLAPIDDPRQMLAKMYGQIGDKDSLLNIVDTVKDDLGSLAGRLGKEERDLLDKHVQLVRDIEQEMNRDDDSELNHPMPEIDPTIELIGENTPRISRMQIDLLVNALANDMTKITSLQYMRSVGQARMSWLGINEGHHHLSHEPDKNKDAVEKLIRINEWFAGELAYLAGKLRDTPEPNGSGSMLDNTLIVWLNELGKGNSHTLDNIPFVLIGGEKATGFKSGHFVKFDKPTPHNRLWLSLAHAMGHEIETFGQKNLCADGPLAI